VLQAQPAPRFSRSDVPTASAPTAPGADTETILRNAGLSDTEIATLRDAGRLT